MYTFECIYGVQRNHTNIINKRHAISPFPLLGRQTEANERSTVERRQRYGRASHTASPAAAVRGEPGAAALRTVPAALLHGLTAKRRTAQSEGNLKRPFCRTLVPPKYKQMATRRRRRRPTHRSQWRRHG